MAGLLADMYLAAPDLPAGAMRRSNYGCVWILHKEPDADTLDRGTNYMVVSPCRPGGGDRGGSDGPVELCLNRFKTAGSHGECRPLLPPALAARVRASLREKPSPLLFYAREEGGFRCVDAKAFAKRVAAVMHDITGAKMGINQLRRSYSSHISGKGLA